MTHPDDRYTDLYHRATIRALREVADDLLTGTVPSEDVTTFADLHDHVDANEYGGLTDDNFCDPGDAAWAGITNAVQSTVSAVLAATIGNYPRKRVGALRQAADDLERVHPPRPPVQTTVDRVRITNLAVTIAERMVERFGPFDPALVRDELDHDYVTNYDLGGMAAMVVDDLSPDDEDLHHAAARVAFAILAEGHVTDDLGRTEP